MQTLRVNPPATAVTRPDGSIRPEIGATSALATVGEGTDVVTGVTPGIAHHRAVPCVVPMAGPRTVDALFVPSAAPTTTTTRAGSGG